MQASRQDGKFPGLKPLLDSSFVFRLDWDNFNEFNVQKFWSSINDY